MANLETSISMLIPRSLLIHWPPIAVMVWHAAERITLLRTEPIYLPTLAHSQENTILKFLNRPITQAVSTTEQFRRE